MEEQVQLIKGNADSRILNRKVNLADIIPASGHGQIDLTFICKLYGIAQQIAQNLTKPGRVRDDCFWNTCVNGISQVQTLLYGFDVHQFEGFFDCGSKVERLLLQRHLVAFHLGEVQDVVYDDKQRISAEPDSLDEVLLLCS